MIDNVIIGGRASGKTVELIRLSAGTNMRIISFSDFGTQYISDKADQMGLKIPKPLTVRDMQRGGIGSNEVLVDDSTEILEKIIGAPIRAMTVCALDTTCMNCLPRVADGFEMNIRGTK